MTPSLPAITTQGCVGGVRTAALLLLLLLPPLVRLLLAVLCRVRRRGGAGGGGGRAEGVPRGRDDGKDRFLDELREGR